MEEEGYLVRMKDASQDSRVTSYEQEYLRIGRRGESISDVMLFWQSSKLAGARWLVERLENEPNGEQRIKTAELLSDLCPLAFRAILECLEKNYAQVGERRAEALLLTLSWANPEQHVSRQRLSEILEPYFNVPCPGVREAAYYASRGLGIDLAVKRLTQALADETDQRLRNLIPEIIAEFKEEHAGA